MHLNLLFGCLISLQLPKELVSLEKGHLSEDQHCRLDMSSKPVSGYNFKDKGLGNFRGRTHDIIDYDLKTLVCNALVYYS